MHRDCESFFFYKRIVGHNLSFSALEDEKNYTLSNIYFFLSIIYCLIKMNVEDVNFGAEAEKLRLHLGLK